MVTTNSTRRFWYTMNYPWLQDGEEILSAVADVETDHEESPTFLVVDYAIDSAAKQVRFLAGGGVDLYQYHVHLTITTSLGQVAKDCVVFNIDDGEC